MSRALSQPKPPRHRGRPRRDTRAAEILQAGFRVFAENGFSSARLDDVAKSAGVAKGTVYLYYPSKEALFEAAVRSRIQPVVGEASRIAAARDTPTIEMLGLVVRAMYGRLADPDVRTLMRIMIAEGQRFPSMVKFYHGEVLSQVSRVLRLIIQRAVERGEIESGAMTAVPEVLVAPGILGAIWQMTFALEEDIPLERFLAAHLDLLERLFARGTASLAGQR